MKDVKKILLATDFSSGASAALKQGVRMCELTGTQLELLHVVDSNGMADLAEALNQGIDETTKQFEQDALAQVNQWLENDKVEPSFPIKVVSGQPLDRILHHIRENEIDLLLVGLTGQEHEGDKDAVGVMASKMIRVSPVRVLAVKPKQAGDFRHVVACIDFSKNSREVLRQAILVAELEQSHLSIIHVYNPPWHRLHYRAPATGSDVAFQKRFKTALTQKLKDFAPIPEAIKHDYHLVDASNCGYGIADFARNRGADLIVLGTKGKSNLHYMLTGSTAERVLRELPCSALVVKPVA